MLSALYSFWVSQKGGLTPFAFYNPFEVASGQQIGSNYDPTGNNTQGRVTVVFRGNWAQATDIARTNVQGSGTGGGGVRVNLGASTMPATACSPDSIHALFGNDRNHDEAC